MSHDLKDVSKTLLLMERASGGILLNMLTAKTSKQFYFY